MSKVQGWTTLYERAFPNNTPKFLFPKISYKISGVTCHYVSCWDNEALIFLNSLINNSIINNFYWFFELIVDNLLKYWIKEYKKKKGNESFNSNGERIIFLW